MINDDQVSPGRGFDTHPHKDMEIISYILAGALAHRDSLGTFTTVRANEVQRISAGTGIAHSESNPSTDESVHLLQIWILPDQQGVTPCYEEKVFAPESKQGQWRRIASPIGRDGAVTIDQDVELYATLLTPGETRSFALRSQRYAWVQVAQGNVSLNGRSLAAGDGAAVSDETLLELTAHSDAEVLLFDLA